MMNAQQGRPKRITRLEPLEQRLLLDAGTLVRLETVTTDVSGPLVATHAGDGSGRIFVAEQTGNIRVLKDGVVSSTPFLNLGSGGLNRIVNGGERGLLGLAFHPDFAISGAGGEGKFYVYYSAPASAGGNHDSVVSEFQVAANPDVANTQSERELLRFRQPFANHNGGDLHFGPDDGLLYISTGDGGSGGDPQNNAQNLGNLLGKILRIDVDGDNGPGGNYGIPNSNPFVGQAGVRAEIYAYGLRNPYRFSFDDGPAPESVDRLFAGDVGQASWEEIDLITSGGNYGWRIREGAHPFNTTDPNPGNLIDPIAEYRNDETADSVIGGFVYRGERYPALAGTYIFADLTGRMFALDESGGTYVLSDLNVAGGNPIGTNIIGFGQDERGELYVLTFNSILSIHAELASLSGRVFHDRNGNGERDPGDEFLNGWTVELLDMSGQVVATQLTQDVDVDSSGSIDPESETGWYRFDVTPGTYSVREAFQDGWRQTRPFPQVQQLARELDEQLNFFSSGDFWEGWGGENEKWLQSATLEDQWLFLTVDGRLYEWDNRSGQPLGSPLAGRLVANLGPQFHHDPTLLINAEHPATYSEVLAAGQQIDVLDFGNFRLATVRGRVFHDRNGDGQPGTGEEFLNGWTVELFDDGGDVLSRQETRDIDLDLNGTIDPATERGWYEFQDLEPQRVFVREVAPDGWSRTAPSLEPNIFAAYSLDQQLEFFTTGDLWENWAGLGEKWIQAGGNGDQWYYILPNGELWRWDNTSGAAGGPPLNGTLTALLDSSYYDDPLALIDAGAASLELDAGQPVDVQNFGVRFTG